MRNLFISSALALCLITAGCNERKPEKPADQEAQVTAPIVIADITLTPEQQTKLDGLVAAAKSVDQFKNPQAYKDAYTTALTYAKTLFPEPHPELEDLRLEIAFGDFLLGDAKTALKGLEDSLPVYIAAGADYRDKRIEINNNLGVAYTQIGQPDKAIGFLESAIREWRVKYAGEANVHLATAIDNLALAYHSIGDSDKALTLNVEALSMLANVTDADQERLNDQIVITMGNRSKYLGESGRLEDSVANSLALISRLEDLLGPDHPRGAYVLSSLASALIELRQYKSAEVNARRATELRETALGKDTAETAVARNILVNALIAQSKYSEALPLASYNFGILNESRGAAAEQTLVANQHKAQSLFGLGKIDDALFAMQANITELENVKNTKSIEWQESNEIYAEMLVIAGKNKQASQVVDNLMNSETFSDKALTFHRVTMLKELIDAKVNYNSPLSAQAKVSEAWLDKRLSDEIYNSGTAGSRDISLKKAYGRSVAAAFARKDIEAAFESLQKYNDSSIGKARARRLIKDQLTDAGDVRILSNLQDLQEERALALRRSYAAAAKGDANQVSKVDAQIKTIDVSIVNLNEGLRGKLRLDTGIKPKPIGDIIPVLSEDTALMMLAETPYGLHILIVSSERASMKTKPARDSAAIFRAATSRLKNPVADGRRTKTFDDLGALLFSEDIQEVIGDRTNLMIIAQGRAARIPLSVARFQDKSVKSAKKVWAVEKYALQYLPSLADLEQSAAHKPSTIENFVGVGFSQKPKEILNHGGSATTAYRGVADVELLSALPDLPNTGNELKQISQSLSTNKTQILADRYFTEADVRALDLAGADILAFATHGLMADELDSVNEPALVVSKSSLSNTPNNDGLLTASEISAMNLSAQWVVLSACNSGSGNGETGEALSGLATAFTNAGAQSLLVSHWPVRDDAGAFLTINTFKNTQAGMSKPAALQKAMNDLRQNTSIPNAGNPSIWAPLVLIGQ